MRLLFVINPIAGGAASNLGRTQLLTRLEALSYPYVLTQEADNENLVQAAIEEYQPQALIAAGGDGTLNLVLRMAMTNKLPMGLIPLGSANGMAKELGQNRDTMTLFDELSDAIPAPIDVLLINHLHYSLHLADVGLNARLIKRFEHWGKRGLFSYFRQLIREVRHVRSFRARFTLDGNHYKEKAVMVAFANSRVYGSGAVLNPIGKLNDGLFEVCVVRPYGIHNLFWLTLHFFIGNLHKTNMLRIYQGKKLVFENRKHKVLQADGEILGQPANFTVEILPLAVKVLLPKHHHLHGGATS